MAVRQVPYDSNSRGRPPGTAWPGASNSSTGPGEEDVQRALKRSLQRHRAEKAEPKYRTFKSDFGVEEYGRPWLEAKAQPQYYERDRAHGAALQLGTTPQHGQRQNPKPVRGDPFAPAPPTPSVEAAIWGTEPARMPEVDAYDPSIYIQDGRQVPGVCRPPPVRANLSRPGKRQQHVIGGRQQMAPSAQRASSSQTSRVGQPTRVSSSQAGILTSDEVRNAVYTDWLARKSAQSKQKTDSKSSSTSQRPATTTSAHRSIKTNLPTGRTQPDGKHTKGSTTPGNTAQKKVQKVLTPEQLFQDSDHVRQAAYEDWMAKKLATEQEKRNARKEAMAELSRSAELEKQKRKEEGKQAFAAWKTERDAKLAKARTEQAKVEKEKKEQEEAEAKDKRENAESAFMAWKAPKDEKLKTLQENKQKQQKEEKEKQRSEQEDKQQSSESAFKGWKSKKDSQILEKLQQQRQVEAEERRHRDELAQRKEEETARALKAWSERKDSSTQRFSRSPSPVIEARMVWSPPGVGDGGVLRRSMSPT